MRTFCFAVSRVNGGSGGLLDGESLMVNVPEISPGHADLSRIFQRSGKIAHRKIDLGFRAVIG
jgi:hypothetical protein